MARRNGEVPADDEPLLGFVPAPDTHPRANSTTADKHGTLQRAANTEIIAEFHRLELEHGDCEADDEPHAGSEES